MIEYLLHFLEKAIIPLGAGGVFLAGVTEEVIAPIPSALVMMTAGFLFVTGPIDLGNILRLVFFVAAPAALGVTLGSLVIYGIAWWSGKIILRRWGKWMGLHWSDVEKLEEKLENSKKEELIIIGARVMPFVPSVAISAFCGFVRMNTFKYLYLTFIGMFFRSIILSAIGWQVGNVYYRYASFISKFEDIGLILIVAVATIAFVILYLKNKKIKI